MTEEQYFFGSDPSLFGLIYFPDKGNGESILMVHPFGEERKSSVRVFSELARSLCGMGFHVMQFDLRGCGDSSYTMKDASITGWIKDIESASEFFEEQSHCQKLTLIGLRFGSYLVSLYASLTPNTIKRLIFLEPVLKPCEYLRNSLRRKLIKELITDGTVSSDRNAIISELKNNKTIDFDGYEITGKFYKELEESERSHTFCDIPNKNQSVSIVTLSGSTQKAVKLLDLDNKYQHINILNGSTPAFWTKEEYSNPGEIISLIINQLKYD